MVHTKIAVVLFNLGGPDAPDAVRPFLFNLFKDPAILKLPVMVRWPLAWALAWRRAKVAAKIYAHLGGKSPLLENTRAQALALERALGGEARVFIAMRYWHPFSRETAAQVKAFAPDRVVLLPLYPQYSTTTTGSSLSDWTQAAARVGLVKPTVTVRCYPEEPGFIGALASLVRVHLGRAKAAVPKSEPRVLFSAHGLPKRVVAAGDPYQDQCERTVKAVVAALNEPDLDWVGCYQSRVGPLEWIGPATDDEIRRAGASGLPVIVVPIAFVSEHSETLVELGIEYRHLAERCGVPYYECVPTVATTPAFIEGLAGLTRAALASDR